MNMIRSPAISQLSRLVALPENERNVYLRSSQTITKFPPSKHLNSQISFDLATKSMQSATRRMVSTNQHGHTKLLECKAFCQPLSIFQLIMTSTITSQLSCFTENVENSDGCFFPLPVNRQSELAIRKVRGEFLCVVGSTGAYRM